MDDKKKIETSAPEVTFEGISEVIPVKEPKVRKTDLPPREPRKPRKPIPPKELAVNVRQFLRARKYQFHRSAGFIWEMKNKFGNLAKKPISEWQIHWEAFWKRPIGPRK